MYETEKRLFGQALAEVISKTLDEELRECKETAACSRAHSRYVKYTVKYGESPKARKISKRTIALIIAAALLLTGCAALVRDQIAGFFMTILETRNVIESTADITGYPETIEEKRIPQVLPEGYELVEEVTTRGSLILTWIDAESNFLIYYQSTHEAGEMDIDNEHSDFGEIQIDEYDVLCVISEDGSRRYIWMDDYVYYISSSCELTKQELEDIVRNIK
jgi:hypothetical protein